MEVATLIGSVIVPYLNLRKRYTDKTWKEEVSTKFNVP